MRSSVLVAALLAALAAAFVLRAFPRGADLRAAGGTYATLDDPESSYRLRLVELGLVTAHAPDRDRFLEPAGDAQVPWPPLFHSVLAVAAAHALEHDERTPELGGIPEERLEAAARSVGPLLGTCAALAAGLLALAAVSSPRRVAIAAAAAILYATHPLNLARESAGSLHAHALVAALGLVQLAAFAVALRAAERVDVTVGALAAGLCAGLGQLAGPESWPVSIAVFATLVAIAVRRPRALKRDAWRTVLLYLAAAFAVFSVPAADGASWLVAPGLARGALALPATSADTLALALLGAVGAAALAWADRRDPLRAALLGALFVSTACALFDRRFYAPLALASVALLSLTLASPSPSRARRAALLGLLACVGGSAGWVARRVTAPAPSPSLVSALHWLRGRSSSPGAFNHPEAEQTWRVAAPPQLFGSVALHARRAVLGAVYDGGATASLPALVELFRAPDAAALAVALANADCPYLVLTPLVLSDPDLDLAPDDFVARMALGAELDLDGQLERVYASARWVTPSGERAEESAALAGPEVTIYRRAAGRTGPLDAPRLRPQAR